MADDPAVVDWVAAIDEVIGRERRPWVPDRRTPFEVARDDALEDIAESRADLLDNLSDDYADEAADRYERHLERGEN